MKRSDCETLRALDFRDHTESLSSGLVHRAIGRTRSTSPSLSPSTRAYDVQVVPFPSTTAPHFLVTGDNDTTITVTFIKASRPVPCKSKLSPLRCVLGNDFGNAIRAHSVFATTKTENRMSARTALLGSLSSHCMCSFWIVFRPTIAVSRTQIYLHGHLL